MLGTVADSGDTAVGQTHTVFAFLEEKGLKGNTPKPNPQRHVPLGGIKDDFNVFLNISLYFL